MLSQSHHGCLILQSYYEKPHRESLFLLSEGTVLLFSCWSFPGVLKFWSRPWVLLLLKVGGLVCLGTQETGSLPPRHKIACLPTKVQVATWLSTKFMFLAFPTLLTSPCHTGRWRKTCIICKLAGLGDRQNLLSVRSVIEELTLTKPFKWTICQSCISQQQVVQSLSGKFKYFWSAKKDSSGRSWLKGGHWDVEGWGGGEGGGQVQGGGKGGGGQEGGDEENQWEGVLPCSARSASCLKNSRD